MSKHSWLLVSTSIAGLVLLGATLAFYFIGYGRGVSPGYMPLVLGPSLFAIIVGAVTYTLRSSQPRRVVLSIMSAVLAASCFGAAAFFILYITLGSGEA